MHSVVPKRWNWKRHVFSITHCQTQSSFVKIFELHARCSAVWAKHSPSPFGQAYGAAARSQLRPQRRCHLPPTKASLPSGGPSRAGEQRGLCHLPGPDCCTADQAPGWWSAGICSTAHPKPWPRWNQSFRDLNRPPVWSIDGVPGSTPKSPSPHWNRIHQIGQAPKVKIETRHMRCYLWRPGSAWQCTASTAWWFSPTHLQLIHCLFQRAARPQKVEDSWGFGHLGTFELLPHSTFHSFPSNVPTVSSQMLWRMMCAATDVMLRRNPRKVRVALHPKLSWPLRETNLQAAKRSNRGAAMPCWFDKLALQCWRPLWNLESPPRMTPPEPPCLEAGPPEASPTGGKVLLARKEVLGLCGRIPVCFLMLWCLLAVASLRRVSANMPFRVGLCRFHCTPRQCETWQGKTAKKHPRIATAPAVSVVPEPPASNLWGYQSHRQWMGSKRTYSTRHLLGCTVLWSLMRVVPVPAQPATRVHMSGKGHSLQRLAPSAQWVAQRELPCNSLW